MHDEVERNPDPRADNVPRDQWNGVFSSSGLAKQLINVMPLGAVAFDHELKIIDCNHRARRFLDNHISIAKALGNISTPPKTEISSNPQALWKKQLHQVLKHGKTYTFENVRCSHNSKNYILHIICIPLAGKKSAVKQSHSEGILLIEDITSKVIMEQDLASAERLAALGKLSARVAHELNNPLDGIMRYINLALRVCDAKDQSQARQYLQESQKGLLRMVKIISELLEYSRTTYSAVEELDVNKIIQDAVKAMDPQAIAGKIKISAQYGPELPHIRAGNLFQVFCNFIKNAIDAMDNDGELEIKTWHDKENLIITFSDNGTGLSDEVREKLFDPFFTTKEAGKGTGLGLSICKDIVERYNGQINPQNRPGGGSIFTITIPLEYTSYYQKKHE